LLGRWTADAKAKKMNGYRARMDGVTLPIYAEGIVEVTEGRKNVEAPQVWRVMCPEVAAPQFSLSVCR
jgi:hypothetical protein